MDEYSDDDDDDDDDEDGGGKDVGDLLGVGKVWWQYSIMSAFRRKKLWMRLSEEKEMGAPRPLWSFLLFPIIAISFFLLINLRYFASLSLP